MGDVYAAYTKWCGDKGRQVQQPQLRMTENHRVREGSGSPAPARKRNRGGRNKKKAAPKAGDEAKGQQGKAAESAAGAAEEAKDAIEDATKSLAPSPANPETTSSA